MARCWAGGGTRDAQTNATYLKLAGPQLVQMFIGDGAKLVRDAFLLAKEKVRAIPGCLRCLIPSSEWWSRLNLARAGFVASLPETAGLVALLMCVLLASRKRRHAVYTCIPCVHNLRSARNPSVCGRNWLAENMSQVQIPV